MTRVELRYYRRWAGLSYDDIAGMCSQVPTPLTAADIKKIEAGAKAWDTRIDAKFGHAVPPHIRGVTE